MHSVALCGFSGLGAAIGWAGMQTASLAENRDTRTRRTCHKKFQERAYVSGYYSA